MRHIQGSDRAQSLLLPASMEDYVGADSRMLGAQFAREVVYRVLRGEQSAALRALASRNERNSPGVRT